MLHRAALACVTALCALPCVSLGQFKAQAAWTYNPIAEANCAVYSPNGSQLIVGGTGGVQIYSASNGALVGCLPSAVSTVNSLVFSPDGKTLAIGGSYSSASGNAGIIEFWNVAEATLTRTILPSQTTVYSLAFSPNGKSLLDGGVFAGQQLSTLTGYPLEEWNVSTGGLIGNLQTKGTSVTSVAFAPNGKSFADAANASSSAGVEVWDVTSGAITETLLTRAGTLNSVEFSPDGKSIADGGTIENATTLLNTGVVEIWNVSAGTLTRSLTTNSGNVESVRYSPDGSKLVDAALGQTSANGVLELWGVSKGQLITTLNTGSYNPERFAIFSPNGKTIADCGFNYFATSAISIAEVREWTVSNGALADSISPFPYTTNNAAVFSTSGQELFVAGTSTTSSSAAAGWIGIWNVATGLVSGSLNTGTNVTTVAVSPDGKTLADGGVESAGGLLELRDSSSGKSLFNLGGTANESVQSVAFSPDSTMLAAGGAVSSTTAPAGLLGLWTVSTGKLIGALATTLTGGVQTVAFSPDGSTLAAGGVELIKGGGGAGVVELWNVKTGKQMLVLFPNMYQVNTIAFSGDGTQLAIGGQQFVSATNGSIGAVQSWNASSGKLTSLYLNAASVSSVVYSPDSKVLYVGTSSGIQSYSAADFTVLGSSISGATNSLTVSGDGTHLAFTTSNPRVGLLLNPLSSITLSTFSVGGGASLTGTVTLSAPAPSGGMEVLLESSDLGVTVPASVIVKAGKTSVSFPIQSTAVTSPQLAVISATAGGFSIATFLNVTQVQLSAMSLTPTSVTHGKTSVGTVALNGPAPANGMLITLSSNLSTATVPVAVVVPAGSSFATFTITTTGSKAGSKAVITAKSGSVTQTATLTIN